MNKVYLLLVVWMLPVGLFAQKGGHGQQIPLVFTHVTVIDATGSPAKPDMTVVVRGDRISSLGKSRKLTIPPNAQVVDATGKFLIPGLWDMHAHPSFGKRFLALFPANGVTGIRVMWGEPEHHKWRKDILAGELIGPRMVLSSPSIGFRPDDFPDGDLEDEGRKIVRKVKAEGADFVKVYNWIPREAYFAMADEAKKQGIPFAGHVPFSVTVAEASDAGQLSIEHRRSIWWGCSTREDQLRKMGTEGRFPGAEPDIGLYYSQQKATELFAHFVKNSTWVCPTVLCGTNSFFWDEEDLANHPGLKYVPLSTVEEWQSKLDARSADALAALVTEDMAIVMKYCQMQLDVIDAMRRAGLGLLAGTDTPLKFCLPGYSLHEELALFVKAGLSPIEALRTATYNPAKFFDRLDSMGTIERGKIADLVLLEADPLQDIRNAQKISAVVFGGRIFDKAALQKMFAQLKASRLHHAAASGNIQDVKLLITEGADVNEKDQQGCTPALAALYARELAVTDLLLEKGADTKDPYIAAYTDNLNEIKNLLEKNTSVGSPNGFTLLHAAAAGGHADVIKFLISKGFEVTATTENGATPLHYASTLSVAEFLISNGANCNKADKNGMTPLHISAEQCLTDIVTLLIDNGADVNVKKNNGQNPLHYAARKGHKEIVELLLAHGADVNIRANYNRTAAEFAMEGNHTEVVELLISKGADISPLHLAISMKDEAKARSLIENGDDVNNRTPDGTTPLNRAIDKGLNDIVELLISRGADVNAGHYWGWTPLHGAAEGGHKDLVVLLIARGAKVNAIDGGGRIPIWYAKTKGHTEIIKLLNKY